MPQAKSKRRLLFCMVAAWIAAMTLWGVQGWITKYPELRHNTSTQKQCCLVKVQNGAMLCRYTRYVEQGASWSSTTPGWNFEWVDINPPNPPRIPLLGGIPLIGTAFLVKDDGNGNEPITGYWRGGEQGSLVTFVRVKLWFLTAILTPGALWGLFIAWRERQVARRSRCIKCGYSRAGIAEEAVCPECGQRP